MTNMEWQSVKLIIWDLDETFWKGTISEGKVSKIQKNINFILDSTDMGIVHSICSKNDAIVVKQKLQEWAIWDYFVFPSVDWTNKGPRIKNIIKNMNLRAENVLFIDDNIQNLEEAKFYCPRLMTGQINGIGGFFDFVKNAEHTDKAHNRLHQYHLLEEKEKLRVNYSSNDDFLLSCNIQVNIYFDCENVVDRLHDLVIRSNQLNYTKVRSTKEELISLFKDPKIKCGYVNVKDRFGDYGIVGFYTLKNKKLIHFVFSCRTLGMQVEQYIYQKLNCPDIEIVGQVASKLKKGFTPPWINQKINVTEVEDKKETHTCAILLKGPCDMSQMYSFLNTCINLQTEFSYTNEKGVLIEGHNHTSQIVTALFASEEEKEEIIAEVPFSDKKMLSTSLQNRKFDVVVLSMLTDGNLGIYRQIKNGWEVAYGEKYYDLTEEKNKEKYINNEIATLGVKFTRETIDEFSKKYKYVDNGDWRKTINNLDKIYDYLGSNTKLILLLGSEQKFEKKCSDSYKGRETEHQKLNSSIRKWAQNKDNVKLICYDKYIKKQTDYIDTINHFEKKVYYDLARDLIEEFSKIKSTDITLKSKKFLFISTLIQKMRMIKSKILRRK